MLNVVIFYPSGFLIMHSKMEQCALKTDIKEITSITVCIYPTSLSEQNHYPFLGS